MEPSPVPEQLLRVFVSYAHADATRALPLVAALRNLNIHLVHSDDLRAGQGITVFMEEGLKNADVVFLLCSPVYSERFEKRQGGVGYEADILTGMRLDNRLDGRVVPVVLQGLSHAPELSAVIPALFRTARSIDARGPWTAALAQELERTLTASQASPPARLRGPRGWLTVPPAPELWFGRNADLRTLKENLGVRAARGSVHCITALKGWPGIGKSALAVTLARDGEVLHEFRDAVLWCSLGNEADPGTILADWAQTLGHDEVLHLAPAAMAEALRRRLEGTRTLLVIDDVAEPNAADLLLRARPDRGAVLVTTREPDVAARLASSSVQPLQGLSEDAAFELLQHLAPGPVGAELEQALALARDLDYLPLALHVAGRALALDAEIGIGPAQLRQQLQSPGALLAELVPPGLGVEAPRTVRMLVERSTKRLTALELQRFAMLSLLVPSPHTFEAADCRTLWDDEPQPTLRVLYHRGLLEVLPGPRYRMHGLLHRLASTLYARELG